MLVTANDDRQQLDRRAARRDRTRREILDAAWELARGQGLAGFTLRDVATRVGMRAPSLYSHFASKHAIYDAMYGEAWTAYEEVKLREEAELTDDLRSCAHLIARTFFDFAVADPARYQLMNQRVIPGFTPSPESYAPAVRVLEAALRIAAERGVTDPDDLMLLLAMIGGLIDQQLANDPGGDRFARMLPRAVDMWADGLGLPRTTEAKDRT
ncbi:MAG TPA: TetR/AcrR family transcriptional regulator [Nocardioides sp.]|jgi:AcrR family transcriptional regulator|nr:TetR/AcrR family transcriptional regulator [Nocardioides sp.]